MDNQFTLKCKFLELMANEFEGKTSPIPMRLYESDNEAVNLMKLATRQVLGIVTVARVSPDYLPTALVSARAAFESSARAHWLLFPEDPYDREARWLVHMTEEVEFLRRQAVEEQKMGINPSETLKRRDQFNDFSKSIADLLQKHGTHLHKKRPDMRQILREMGEERTYFFYSYLSQATHATHSSTWLYRTDGVGNLKKRREKIPLEMWEIPLSIARFVFKGPGLFILKRFGLETETLQGLVDETGVAT